MMMAMSFLSSRLRCSATTTTMCSGCVGSSAAGVGLTWLHQQRRTCSSNASAGGLSGLTGANFSKALEEASVARGLPPRTDVDKWAALGKLMVSSARQLDLGPSAIEECFAAREQLESIVQGCGYDMDVHIFGGLSILNLLEVGGDVDFVAVADWEPEFEESAEIVTRLSREMRRLGLRANGVSRARVPVVKVDRASFALPGTPIHANAKSCVFQFAAPLSNSEQSEFAAKLTEDWSAVRLNWENPMMVVADFETPSDAVAAMAHIRHHKKIEIPLRSPIEPREGPHLFRYPFDLCLNTTGLRNSELFHNYLSTYPFARHFLMMVKRWGRSSGVINSFEGLLCSYAVTVMVVHFLTKMGAIPTLDLRKAMSEPRLLPKQPNYRPLEGESDGDVAELGYLLMQFFQYFGYEFDYTNHVVCTTKTVLTKATLPNWVPPALAGEVAPRPPFYNFCIKDPYNTDNIARNLTEHSTSYVKSAHELALQHVTRELSSDPSFLLHTLITDAPRPLRRTATEGKAAATTATANEVKKKALETEGTEAALGVGGDDGDGDEKKGEESAKEGGAVGEMEAEARRMLAKERFQQRKNEVKRFGQGSAVRHHQAQTAQDMTQTMVAWMKRGSKAKDEGQGEGGEKN